MNRDVRFVEFKNGDQHFSAEHLAHEQLSKINHAEIAQPEKDWVFYCNDKRVDNWKKKIRPRSKLLLVSRSSATEAPEIVFENKEIMILNKPAGLPTQPTLKSFEDNLFERIRYHFIQSKNFPIGIPYVGLHHRLDRGTSGLVLMTKQRSANKEVSDLFKNRKIKKRYRARTEIGEKAPEKKWRQVDFIKRGSTKKLKFFFEVASEGDEAISEFEWLKTEKKYHEFQCRPLTGRTHQLRVQLAHKGYPILGDPVYGSKKTADRLMLHAEGLRFQFKSENYDIEIAPPWSLARP